MRRKQTPGGIALIVLIGIIALLLLIIVSLGSTSLQNLSEAAGSVYNRQAYYAAQAGLAASLGQLSSDSTWSSGFSNVSLSSTTNAKYSVTVTNNSSGTAAVSASDGTSVPVGGVYLRSTGSVTKPSGSTVLSSKVVSAMAFSEGLFSRALLGSSNITMGGNASTDGYDSRVAGYPTSVYANGGTVATNGTTSGVVTMSGSSEVDGDVIIGPGGVPSTAIVGSSHATGTSVVNTSAISLPQVTPPTFSGTASDVSVSTHGTQSISPGMYNNLTVASHGTVNLSPGTYYFKGNISLASHGTLAISGATTIYLDGNFSASSGGIGNSGAKPRNLILYGTSTSTSISITASGSAYMGVYAPNATVTLGGNGDLYGSFVGNAVVAGGTAAVHYDRDLVNVGTGGKWELTGFRRW